MRSRDRASSLAVANAIAAAPPARAAESAIARYSAAEPEGLRIFYPRPGGSDCEAVAIALIGGGHVGCGSGLKPVPGDCNELAAVAAENMPMTKARETMARKRILACSSM